jgi:hypothetical protein
MRKLLQKPSFKKYEPETIDITDLRALSLLNATFYKSEKLAKSSDSKSPSGIENLD